MNVEISKNDINRSHEIGKPNPGKKRPKIVKFIRYNIRKKIYSNKKKLKDSGNFITESFTAAKMEQL